VPSKSARSKDPFKVIESKMTPASIRRSDAKARKTLLGLRLAAFRKAMKADQMGVKGFSQPAVSKIESRGDIKLSTLVEYCRGLNAELEIAAKPARKGGKRFVLLRSA
jgi:hypothetical protein